MARRPCLRNFGNEKDTGNTLIPVQLWFGCPHGERTEPIMRSSEPSHRGAASQYRRSAGNSTPSAPYRPFGAPPAGLRGSEKALTVRGPASIRPAMAAGATPPPLFFEHRRRMSTPSEPMRPGGILESTVKKHISDDQANRRHAHVRLRSVTVEGRLRKWPIRLPPRRRRARLPAAPSSINPAAPRCAVRCDPSKRRSSVAIVMQP